MKPVLYLDPEMRKTHWVPEDDSLYNVYLDLCYDYQFADAEYPERGEAALKAIDDFKAIHRFKEVSLVMGQTLLLGAGSALRGYGKKSGERGPTEVATPKTPVADGIPNKSYVTHPDNVANWTEEQRAKLDIRPMKTSAEYMKEWGLA